ncbi:MAG: hypothetical protein IT334_03450, partial [Thermomicrobiales bacterium]|nr:hypothetical protein [Thermomicrobiales bacterium]
IVIVITQAIQQSANAALLLAVRLLLAIALKKIEQFVEHRVFSSAAGFKNKNPGRILKNGRAKV